MLGAKPGRQMINKHWHPAASSNSNLIVFQKSSEIHTPSVRLKTYPENICNFYGMKSTTLYNKMYSVHPVHMWTHNSPDMFPVLTDI